MLAVFSTAEEHLVWTKDRALLFTETIKMRALHTLVWAGVSVFWIALSIMMALDKGSLFGPVFFLLLGLPILILPAIKYVFGRVIVEIASDGMYVETTFPRRKRLKLFGWEQVNSCELKYYPEAGHVGFHKRVGSSARGPMGFMLHRSCDTV